MVIIVTLALLLLAFFFLRKSSSAALLAMIAGLAVFEMFGLDLANQIQIWFPEWDLWIIEKVIYFALILVFPMILYARSGRGGLHGILRLAHTAVIALFLTALLAQPLSEIFAFDDLSRDVATWIGSIQGIVVIVGLIGAYLDILLGRSADY
jgi:hypothetical protein